MENQLNARSLTGAPRARIAPYMAANHQISLRTPARENGVVASRTSVSAMDMQAVVVGHGRGRGRVGETNLPYETDRPTRLVPLPRFPTPFAQTPANHLRPQFYQHLPHTESMDVCFHPVRVAGFGQVVVNVAIGNYSKGNNFHRIAAPYCLKLQQLMPFVEALGALTQKYGPSHEKLIQDIGMGTWRRLVEHQMGVQLQPAVKEEYAEVWERHQQKLAGVVFASDAVAWGCGYAQQLGYTARIDEAEPTTNEVILPPSYMLNAAAQHQLHEFSRVCNALNGKLQIRQMRGAAAKLACLLARTKSGQHLPQSTIWRMLNPSDPLPWEMYQDAKAHDCEELDSLVDVPIQPHLYELISHKSDSIAQEAGEEQGSAEKHASHSRGVTHRMSSPYPISVADKVDCQTMKRISDADAVAGAPRTAVPAAPLEKATPTTLVGRMWASVGRFFSSISEVGVLEKVYGDDSVSNSDCFIN